MLCVACCSSIWLCRRALSLQQQHRKVFGGSELTGFPDPQHGAVKIFDAMLVGKARQIKKKCLPSVKLRTPSAQLLQPRPACVHFFRVLGFGGFVRGFSLVCKICSLPIGRLSLSLSAGCLSQPCTANSKSCDQPRRPRISNGTQQAGF